MQVVSLENTIKLRKKMAYGIHLYTELFGESDLIRRQSMVRVGMKVVADGITVTSASDDFSVRDYLPQNALKFLKAADAVDQQEPCTVSFNYSICDVEFTPSENGTLVFARGNDGNSLNPDVTSPGIEVSTSTVVSEHVRYARSTYDRFVALDAVDEDQRTLRDLRQLFDRMSE